MTDKKLTDEEIIKALEGSILNAKWCDSKAWSIEIYKLESALDLINCQKAENEMLKKRISDKKHALFEQQEYTAELQQRLETKCDDCDNIMLSRSEYWKAIKAAKAEAYKEFAEKLKAAAMSCLMGGKYYKIITTRCIDTLLKEMAGEE